MENCAYPRKNPGYAPAREQLEKQLKEMSSRNELLETELGKANNQIQLLTGKHSKLYCQILERGRLSIET